MRDVPLELSPFYSTRTVSLPDTGVHDAQGARLVIINGVAYDHPVAQAQFAMALLNSYRITGDSRDLALAEVQAQRLLDRAVSSRGAIYFPYPFTFARHGIASDSMIPPWYSAMAQGLALPVFIDLWRITGVTAYRDAAIHTYNSFVNPRASGVPWTVFVDAGGYVWFEEYAQSLPDRTINGQFFAIFGLYEYYRFSRSADALRLFRGGLTTMEHYFPQIRVPGWLSVYCLQHRVENAVYHVIQAYQFLETYRLTGSVSLAREADTLLADYPDYAIKGTVVFSGGAHTGYVFDSAGRITASRSYTLSRASTAPASTRRRIITRSGSWFLISAGIWSGYWIQETPGRAFVAGLLPRPLVYDPVRPAWFAAGTYVGYRYDATGHVIASRSATLSRQSWAHIDRWGVINGVAMVEVIDGIWAGYWVRFGGGVTD